MTDLNELPYAEWLEMSLRNLMTMPIDAICICTKTEDGCVGTGYWNASMSDKLIFSGIIQQDAMIETLQSNGMLDLDEEDEDDYEQEEVP